MKIQVDFKLYGAEWCYKVYAKGTETHKLTSFGHNLYDMIRRRVGDGCGANMYRDGWKR